MSGASNALVSLKFIILISTVFCLLRALLMTAIPTEKDSGNGLEKVTWTATRSSLMCLVLHAVRGLGGLILLTGAQGGMCLTSVSLYVHTAGLGPLLFICLVSPFLQNGQGHSLLGYAPQINQWEEEERIVTDKLSDSASAGILRNENTDLQENEDDYQM